MRDGASCALEGDSCTGRVSFQAVTRNFHLFIFTFLLAWHWNPFLDSRHRLMLPPHPRAMQYLKECSSTTSNSREVLMNLRAFWVVLATSVNAKHVSLNPIGWLMFMQGTSMYMGTSPKQQEWWGKLIALGCIKLYTVNYLVAYVREHSPTAEKRIIRPERAFSFLL